MAKGGRISPNAWQRVRKVVLAAEGEAKQEFVPKRPKIFGNVAPFQTFLVQLASDSGTGALAHPYTYTAKNAATGAVLKNADGTDATGLSPRFARQQFAVTTAATNGHACRDENGVWILDDCDEVYERCA